MFFSINQTQNSSNQANRNYTNKLNMKIQNFKKNIRRKQIQQYQSIIRHRLLFKSQHNYDLLKGINLIQCLNVLKSIQNKLHQKQYEYLYINEEENHNNKHIKIFINLQQQQNSYIKKSIQQIFIYSTSTQADHLSAQISDIHLNILVQLLKNNVIFIIINQKQKLNKNSIEVKNKLNYKYNLLPIIYVRILVILTQHTFYQPCFQAGVNYLKILFDLIDNFTQQIKVLQCCLYSFKNFIASSEILRNQIIEKFRSNENNKYCILTKINEIFINEISNFSREQKRSVTVISTILQLYQQCFQNISVSIFPKNKKLNILNNLKILLKHDNCDQNILNQLISTILVLYRYENLNQFPELIIQSKTIITQIIKGLLAMIKKFQLNQFKHNFQENKKLFLNSISIAINIFQYTNYQNQQIQYITSFLLTIVQNQIAQIFYEGLRSTQDFIVFKTLELVKSVLLWGDFLQIIYEDVQTMRKIFYYAHQQDILKLKNQAIYCLCNIVSSYFQHQKYYQPQRAQIYYELTNKNDLIQILVQNLDKYASVQLNTQILQSIKIFCQFWQVDIELQRQNLFWIKFVELKGQLKLIHIITEQRDYSLHILANQILDRYSNKKINQILKSY